MRTSGWLRALPLGLVAVLTVGCNTGAGGVTPLPTAPAGSGQPTPTTSGTASQSLPPASGPLHLTAGPDLCALLTAADFTAIGVAGAGPVNKNAYDNEFYCTFAGKSSATGGIELDVFIVDDPTQIADSFNAVAPPSGAEDVTASVPGAEAAALATMSSGGPDFAQIGVRSGNFVFGLGIPPTGDWHGQLIALAGLILGRAAAVAGGQASLPPQLALPDDLCSWVTADDLAPLGTEALTFHGPPTISGSVYFEGTQGTYLGKQVTCRYGYGSDPNTWMGGLIMDVGHTPNDLTLARKVYDEQVAYYADLASSTGAYAYEVTPLPGVGDAAQKVKEYYRDGSGFISWTLEAVKGAVVVRMALDSGADRTKPDGDPALATLLAKILNQAVASITVP
jgi:hypothetical protein